MTLDLSQIDSNDFTSQWVKDNELDSVGTKKLFGGVKLGELVELSNEEIKEYAKEIKLGVIERKRFEKGIRKLKGMTPRDRKLSKTPSIVDALSDFAESYDIINNENLTVNIEDKLNKAMSELDRQSKRCKDQIRDTFNEFRTRLTERELKLLSTLDETVIKKRMCLSTQLDYIKENNDPKSMNLQLAADPNLSLGIDRDEIIQSIQTAGFIQGAPSDSKEAQEAEMEKKRKEMVRQQCLTVEKLKEVTLFERDCAKQRTDSIRLQSEVALEIKNINTRTEQVESELATAEPMLEEARKSVSQINKKQLLEIKSMKKPPAVIELVMNAVTLMLGYKIKEWKDIQKALANPKFIPDILKFDTNKMKKKTRVIVKKKYATHKDFTFERVNKASKVAGPLVIWCNSQIKFSELLDIIRPMQKENKQLNKRLAKKQKQATKCVQTVNKLEDKISQCRVDINRMVENMINLQENFEIKNISK